MCTKYIGNARNLPMRLFDLIQIVKEHYFAIIGTNVGILATQEL